MLRKTLLFVLLQCVFLTPLVAQETFAPLLSEQTVLFAHVDIRKVDVDNVKDSLLKISEDACRDFGFDERSSEAILRESKIEINKLADLVRPYFNTITKEFGINELAVIADMRLIENGVAVVVAVPWKGKNEKDIDKLIATIGEWSGETLPADYRPYFSLHDCLILAIPQEGGGDVAAMKTAMEILKTPGKVESGPFAEALKEVAGAEIKIVGVVPNDFAKMVLPLLEEEGDMPQEVKGPINFAVQNFRWAAFGVKAGSKEPQKFVVGMKSASSARQFRNVLDGLIDWGVFAARAAIEMQMAEEETGIRIPPLVYEFAKGVLRKMLPKVDGSKLVFELAEFGYQSPESILTTYATTGVLVALLLPAVQASREAARRMHCADSEKQIILAIHNYHDTHTGLPPLYTVDKNGKPLHSWRVLILPFLEQTVLYERIRLDEPWDSEYNKQFHNQMPFVYICPTNPLAGGDRTSKERCCFSAIASKAMIPAKDEKSITGGGMHNITDGTSNTLAIVEVRKPFCWMDPTADVTMKDIEKGISSGSLERNPDVRIGSFHPRGMNAALFDGSVSFIVETIDKTVLKAIVTPSGGETVSVP